MAIVTLHLFEKTLSCNIHIQGTYIGHALSGVKMMGELGRGRVALRDVVVQLQLDITNYSAQNVKSRLLYRHFLSFLKM